MCPTNRVGLRLLTLSGLLGTLLLGPIAAPAATIIVNGTNDPAGYNSNITVATLGATVTLRDAVNAANNTPGDDTITFAPALGGAVVQLSLTGLNLPFAYGPVTNDGLTALYITSNIAFTPPPGGVTIKKDPAVTGYLRLFDIGPGAVVSLSGMTVSGGSANNGANFWNQGVLTLDSVTVQYGLATTFSTYGGTGFGGGIFNLGALNVLNSTFYADDCLSAGGAIFNANGSSLSASNTLFNQCYASFGGGAVLNEAGALAQFVGCKFTGDSLNADYYWFTTDPYNGGGAVMNVGAAGFSGCSFSSCSTVNTLNGGAILNAGTGSVNACTFSGNSVPTGLGNGGAIENSGTLVVTNGTFTANSARYGSAIDHSAGSLSLDHCTIMRNQMVTNAYSYAVQLGSTCSVRSSILSENTVIDPATTNLVSRDVSGGYSPATFNIVGSTNVGVGALSDNGGPVLTMPLQVGSPAVNGVQWFSDTVPADARGVARCGTWPDIGAYELLITTPAITSSPSTAFIIGQTNSFQIAVSSAPPASFSYIGSLPSGVTLTSSGLLSGVPASGTKGNYTITVIATNYYQYSGVQSFTLTVCDGTLTDPYSWSLNGDNINGGLSLANNTFTFTDGTGGENRSAWFRFQQYVSAFEATFIYQDIGGGGADGVAFVMQNDPAGILAIGGGGGGLGYTGISPSVGMMLNIYAGAPGGSGIFISTDGTGLASAYNNTSPVNLATGNPIKVDLLYLGSAMVVSLTDLTSNLTYTTNFTIDIPGTVGANKAWIGLTGSEGGSLSHQTVSNFTYTVLDAGPVIVVNSTNDPGGFNPNLIISALGTNVTLRDAISAANNTPGTVNIRFAPGLSGTTIPLYQVGNSSYGSSAFGISGHLVIDNTNASTITLTRATSGDLRFFNVLAGGNLTIRNLRLTGGRFPYSGYNGPSLYNSGTLLVDHSRVDGGYTPTYGGGLYTTGNATINASTIDSCFANFAGGGIYNAGTLAISASTICSNTTAHNNGVTAGGGAVFNSGTLTLTNCTIAYNVSSGFYCGGIWNYSGSLSLYSCTVAGNTDSGWGSPVGLGGWQSSIYCRNCIVADSSSVGLIGGSSNNQFYNPGLGAFGSYGGPTAVFPLPANSAAIAAGVFDPGSTNDQRGVLRHNPPDIGAFEFNTYVESVLVTTTNDEFNGTSDARFGTGTSLREAIVMNPDASVIQFDPSLAGQTIVLTNVSDTSAGPSALVIDKDLTRIFHSR
ncbi:MAG: choice-of-anchor Q domain-containing protein [Verrucomicrobiae bacterium]|nr:choice-of-anchor Q domain-containing protein [Verrucomicrobiae bacterium]